MSDLDTLEDYRWEEAVSTLADAKVLFAGGSTPRSVINRAYYAMFYGVLALFLKTGFSIETSKHSGIIALFDREYVRTGRVDRSFSRMLHLAFDARQEFDYKEFTTATPDMAEQAILDAERFLEMCDSFDVA